MEHSEKEHPSHVLQTPIWILVIRGFQFLISLIILAMAGKLISDAYLDEDALALAIGLLTWFVVGYIVISEKVPGAHVAYNIIAVIVLDGVFMVLWLATFAAVAARRATFTVDVDVDSCYDDGSLIDSVSCFKKRDVILFESGSAMMAAIAGLGALVWLLFITTFSWTMVQFFRGRKEGRFLTAAKTQDGYHMEAKPLQNQPQPNVAMQQPPVQQFAPQPQGPYSPDGQYPAQTAYQPSMSPPPQDQYQQQPYQQQPYPQQPYEQQQPYDHQQQYGQYPVEQAYYPPDQQQPPLQQQPTGSPPSPYGSELPGQEQQYAQYGSPPPQHH